jgi:predicted nucleic acid-binding protein
VASLNDQVRKLELSQWYSTVVMVMFAGRVLEADENSLVRWHALLRALQIDRKPNPPVDVLVAAIAREHECGVATRDTAPFVACGIPVLNPWTGERFNGA